MHAEGRIESMLGTPPVGKRSSLVRQKVTHLDAVCQLVLLSGNHFLEAQRSQVNQSCQHERVEDSECARQGHALHVLAVRGNKTALEHLQQQCAGFFSAHAPQRI